MIAALHRQYDAPRPSGKFNSEIAEIRVAGEKVLLQSPLTFMNLSGQAVRAAMDYYKLPADDLLVICDDFNLPLARLRIKPSGSAGGQNGLRDIIQRLGTPDFARLRIGIGQPTDGREPARWVLGRFQDDEISLMETAIERAAEAACLWVEQGVDPCMNRFNADPRPARPESELDEAPPERSGGLPRPPEPHGCDD